MQDRTCRQSDLPVPEQSSSSPITFDLYRAAPYRPGILLASTQLDRFTSAAPCACIAENGKSEGMGTGTGLTGLGQSSGVSNPGKMKLISSAVVVTSSSQRTRLEGYLEAGKVEFQLSSREVQELNEAGAKANGSEPWGKVTQN